MADLENSKFLQNFEKDFIPTLLHTTVSRKRPQWKKTAVEKVYGDKDYSI